MHIDIFVYLFISPDNCELAFPQQVHFSQCCRCIYIEVFMTVQTSFGEALHALDPSIFDCNLYRSTSEVIKSHLIVHGKSDRLQQGESVYVD